MKQYNVVECSIYNTQRILKPKWVIVILHALFDGEKSFNELLKCVTYISNGQLALNLDMLVKEGIVGCGANSYKLTDSGCDLFLVTQQMKLWSHKYRSGED